MTKIHLQPKRTKPPAPKRKGLTVDDVRALAESMGLNLCARNAREYWLVWALDEEYGCQISIEARSRSAALRVMKAALEAMKEEGK